MVPSKLIGMIEDHWEQISTNFIEDVKRDPHLLELGRLPQSELRDRARDILKNLSHWLTESDDNELARRYEDLGRRRCAEGIPLSEVVYGYQDIRRRIIDWVRAQGVAQTTIELYAAEELEHALARFFDHVVFRIVRGYELKLKEGVRPARIPA